MRVIENWLEHKVFSKIIMYSGILVLYFTGVYLAYLANGEIDCTIWFMGIIMALFIIVILYLFYLIYDLWFNY